MLRIFFTPSKDPYRGQKFGPEKEDTGDLNEEEIQRLQDDQRLYWGKKENETTPCNIQTMTDLKKRSCTAAALHLERLGINQHASSEVREVVR